MRVPGSRIAGAMHGARVLVCRLGRFLLVALACLIPSLAWSQIPTLQIDNVTLAEGNTGTTDFIFNVTLSATSGSTVTVDYETRNGSALAGTDYVATSGTVTFDPGVTSQPLTVQVLGDTDYENQEVFYVDLSIPVNATISDGTGNGWITNDDVRLLISDVTQVEGTGGTTAFVFDVTLSASYDLTVTVDYATRNGSALGGTDYMTTSGTVTFDPGETSQPVTVQVYGDTDHESQEYFYVDLTNGVNASIIDSTALGRIDNDDVRLSISDVTLVEGTGGTTAFVFDVTLSASYHLAVTVDYATRNGSAVAGTDYVATSGTLTFAPGVTSQPVTVQVYGDTNYENQEYFYVDLADAVNASIYDSYGLGRINDDDVRIDISNVTQAEGTGGTTDFVFDLTLSASYGLPVTVDYATRDASALAGSDYVATSGTVTFDSGETSQTVVVQVIGDTDHENMEYFWVDLSNAVNASIYNSHGIGYINNDDVHISISNVTQAEGTGGTTDFVFNLTLSGSLGLSVTVDYATRDASALAGSDYVATSGTVTFDPGETSQTVVVQVIGDTDHENMEYFYVDLSNAVNASINTLSGIGYIDNDDVQISISNVTLPEGDSGPTDFVFDVTLSSAYHLPVTVDHATRSLTATAGSDYVATSGTVTFAVGETSQPVTVQVNGDTDLENDEYFYVDLTNNVNASIHTAFGLGTIQNDDILPAISIDDVAASEGNGGSTDFVFTVSLTAAGATTVTVNYATSSGTAAAPADYTAVSGTLTFTPGETSQTITVPVAGDDLFELDETFTVILSSPVNATITDGWGEGTILNDEPPVEISIDDVSEVEGDAGTVDFVFTLSLSGPSALSTSVEAATADGTTSAGIDYAPGQGSVIFPPGQMTQTFTVLGMGDPDHEIDETFFVNLSAPVNGVIGTGQGTGTLLDDDAMCTPAPVPVLDLSVAAAGGGSDLVFTWTDVAGAISYYLYEDTVPVSPCLSEAGSAASGAVGITLPMPSGDTFYLLASRNATCGNGARRFCAHDKCEPGSRLDSACDPCVASICASDSSCCGTAWSPACVSAVTTVCGITCN